MVTLRLLMMVGIGSFFGGILRFLISLIPLGQWRGDFPIWTLCINILGCFALGILVAYGNSVVISRELRLALTVGLCGGFTTFSTFSLESLFLLELGRIGLFSLYVFLSITLGILAAWSGKTLYLFLRCF